jgi:hypothetical protein
MALEIDGKLWEKPVKVAKDLSTEDQVFRPQEIFGYIRSSKLEVRKDDEGKNLICREDLDTLLKEKAERKDAREEAKLNPKPKEPKKPKKAKKAKVEGDEDTEEQDEGETPEIPQGNRF